MSSSSYQSESLNGSMASESDGISPSDSSIGNVESGSVGLEIISQPLTSLRPRIIDTSQVNSNVVPIISNPSKLALSVSSMSNTVGTPVNNIIKYGNTNGSFKAVFTDGYGFRSLIEYLKPLHKVFYFRFSKTGIRLVQHNDSNTVINEIMLDAYELTEYWYDNPNSTQGAMIVALDAASLRDNTKVIGKKDQFLMYRVKDKPDIFLQILRANQSNTMVIYLKPLMVNDNKLYRLPKIGKDRGYRNCAISATNFARTCNDLAATKRETFLIKAYPTGFYCIDQTTGYTSGGVYKLGNPRPQNVGNLTSSMSNLGIGSDSYHVPSKPAQLVIKPKNELFQLTVPLDVIKALSKIGALANTGTVKLLATAPTKDDPVPVLGIISDIGHFGTLRVFVRNSTQNVS